MSAVTLRRIKDWGAVEACWRELETRSNPSFFQSWTWLGCVAEQRFADPVLLQVTDAGAVVGLALFNRGRNILGETLWLGETGHRDLDSVFTEHNGPLLAAGYEHLAQDCINAALASACAPSARWPLRRVVLSGVPDQVAHVARRAGRVLRDQARDAPLLDLRLLQRPDYPDNLGRTTRYQLRRSLREISHRGPVSLRRAETCDEALRFLDQLARLHQISWTDRGKPGSFATDAFVRFHRALVARGWPRGEIDLWCLSAGADTLAYLYNFRFRGTVSSYQSGVDYRTAGPHERPGLTAHHLAIEQSRSRGDHVYDFLAGADRYKVNLANGTQVLNWLTIIRL